MGQVWFKADLDGTNEAASQGGRGSVLAVTAQNAGADGVWGTGDDLEEPLNSSPAEVSIDSTPGNEDDDLLDRVRGFFSYHSGGSNFVYADGSTHFVPTEISAPTQTVTRLGLRGSGTGCRSAATTGCCKRTGSAFIRFAIR